MKSLVINISTPFRFWSPYVPWSFKWIRRRHISHSYPESFNEMSRRQLLGYIKWVFLRRADLFDLDDKGTLQVADGKLYDFTYLKMLRIVLGIPSSIFRRLQNTDDNCQVFDLVKSGIADFVFHGRNNLVRNHLPHFRCWFKKYYGPGDELGELVLLEFALAYIYYSNFMKTGNIKDLDMLVACLYRPRKSKKEIKDLEWDGDLRQRFNQYQVSDIARQIKTLSLKKKLLVLVYFSGCRENMEIKYPASFSNKSSGGGNNNGWIEFIIAAAGDKFGDIDKTAYANIHTIFKAMAMVPGKEKDQPESVI